MATTPASLVTEINGIYGPLLAGLPVLDLNIPLELVSVDLISDQPEFEPIALPAIPTLSLADLTAGDGTLTGTGSFDIVMKALNKHLEAQFKQNNISASERGKVYIQALELALTQGANYLVQSNKAAWEGETAKRQAALLEVQRANLVQGNRTAILETVTAKLNMAKTQLEGYVAQGNLIGTKVKIGDVYHDILAKEAQQNLLDEQVDTARAQTKDTLKAGGAITGILAIEKVVKGKQSTLLDEQIDAARAQTKGTVTGGGTVQGILGAQKSLYDQQRQSYIHDSMNKAAKLLSDAWTTQKTVDDGWTPPSVFLNTSLDPKLQTYLSTVGM